MTSKSRKTGHASNKLSRLPKSKTKREASAPTRKRSRRGVQGAHVNYALHTLGWRSFQDLCVSISTEVLGKPVEVFLPSKDGGRDGAFVSGPDGKKSTIQCKSTSAEGANLSLSLVSDELSKVRSLVKRGLAHEYILLTNFGISGIVAADLNRAFKKAGVKSFQCYGRDWITQQIRESARLRMMVPRVYGLGDLSQIIDERAYAQARYILSAMGDDLRCFVTTEAHRRSVDALTRHNFVLLLGDPASGKSTIGATLAIGALDDGAAGTIRISSAQEFKRHWNPDEPDQFFWIDDAFGPTQYSQSLVDGWNQEILTLRAAVKAGARILMTSRNYIWDAAKRDLKISQFPLLNKSQVIINVQGLTDEERAQILYNHLRLGDQPSEFRRALKKTSMLTAVATNDRFLPETARRLGSSIFTSNLVLTPHGLTEFVEKPEPFLREVLEGLDRASQAAIALIFLYGRNGVPSPLVESSELLLVERLYSVSLAEIGRALEHLGGSLVLLIQQEEGSRWVMKHPTIHDAFASLVSLSPELVELYLGGAKIERLLSEVVCSGVSIEGAYVTIPPSLYERLADRVGDPERPFVRRFLSARCDARFLQLIVNRTPSFVANLVRGIATVMAYDSNTDLLARMKELGTLEEEGRLAAAERIAELTIDFVDASIYRDRNIRSILSEEEMAMLEKRIKEEILENLDQVITDWRYDWSTSDMRAHMEELKDNLERFQRNLDLKGLEELEPELETGFERIDDLIADIEDDEPTTERHASPTAPVTPSRAHLEKIFEDIDE